MDEGRRHFEELQASDWVDGEVDYADVMAGLAAGGLQSRYWPVTVTEPRSRCAPRPVTIS